MGMFLRHISRYAAIAVVLILAQGQAAKAADLSIFAAASLRGALEDIAEGWTARTGADLTLVFAGSSAIARQVQAGAPADLVILANTDWMDVLAASSDIRPETRIDLLTNRLVVIGGAHEDTPLDLSDPRALSDRLSRDRLALALTEAVPAGIYARAALDTLGIWDSVVDRVVEADNVRAALALVAAGAAAYGIVYATDAGADPRVTVVAEVPRDSHPPIRYPAARVAHGDNEAAEALLTYLQSPFAQTVFNSHGFGLARAP